MAVIGIGPGLPDYDLNGLRGARLHGGDLFVAVPLGHRFADRPQVSAADLADEEWVAGAGLKGEPQFGAWPTLDNPRIAYTAREWHARLGMVAAGLGITVVPQIAAPGLPADIVTVQVDDPTWLGRTAVAATREERSANLQAVTAALRRIAGELGEGTT